MRCRQNERLETGFRRSIISYSLFKKLSERKFLFCLHAMSKKGEVEIVGKGIKITRW
jgi:hypothetical protein